VALTAPGGSEMATEHTAKCQACGRVRRFRSAAAMLAAKPTGRVCAAKIRNAALGAAFDGLNEKQCEKALEIVAEGGVQLTGNPRVFLVIAVLGAEVYKTHVNGNCTCRWGLNRKSALVKPCAHTGAVRLFAAASGSARKAA
jgi:hypothetical protein